MIVNSKYGDRVASNGMIQRHRKSVNCLRRYWDQKRTVGHEEENEHLPHKQFLHTVLCEENIARLNAGTSLSICDRPTNIMLLTVFLISLKHNPKQGYPTMQE
jgi:hypothetical protein